MENMPLDIEFAVAITDLPEVPSRNVLNFLKESSYGVSDINQVKVRGKELQREHGLDAVPPASEIEWAAGLWDLIRTAIIEKREAN